MPVCLLISSPASQNLFWLSLFPLKYFFFLDSFPTFSTSEPIISSDQLGAREAPVPPLLPQWRQISFAVLGDGSHRRQEDKQHRVSMSQGWVLHNSGHMARSSVFQMNLYAFPLFQKATSKSYLKGETKELDWAGWELRVTKSWPFWSFWGTQLNVRLLIGRPGSVNQLVGGA